MPANFCLGGKEGKRDQKEIVDLPLWNVDARLTIHRLA